MTEAEYMTKLLNRARGAYISTKQFFERVHTYNLKLCDCPDYNVMLADRHFLNGLEGVFGKNWDKVISDIIKKLEEKGKE